MLPFVVKSITIEWKYIFPGIGNEKKENTCYKETDKYVFVPMGQFHHVHFAVLKSIQQRNETAARKMHVQTI